MLQPRESSNYQRTVQGSSDTIKVTRVICIFFMTYVHVYLFSDADLEGAPQFQLATSIIRDVLGRVSVPLLSIVSGFLLVGYLSRRSFKQAAANRFTVLLVPIITWNLIWILVFSLLGALQGVDMNDLFPFLGHGSQHHLTFLRDLFVVSMMAPVLIWALKCAPVSTVAAVILLTGLIETWPIILRAQILMYFTFGLLFGLYRLEDYAIYKAGRQLAYIAFGMLLVQVAIGGIAPLDQRSSLTKWITLPIGVLTFWGISRWAATKSSLMHIVRVVEPAVFLMYLSHGVVARLLSGVYSQLEFAHRPWIYTVVWLTIPILCCLAALAGRWLLHQLPNKLSILVAGKA